MSHDEFIPASETYDPGTRQTQQRLSSFGDGDGLDLARLSPKERRAYVAVRMNDVSIEDHADAINTQPAVVRAVLDRAGEKLGER